MFELKVQGPGIVGKPAIILLVGLVLAAVVMIVEKIFHVPEAEEIGVFLSRNRGFSF